MKSVCRLHNTGEIGLTKCMAKPRSFLAASVRFEGVFDVVLLLGLSGAWLGLLGRFHWALDLLSHFRWQYLCLCLGLVAWALFRRRQVLLVVAMSTLLLNGWLIGSLALQTSQYRVPQGDRLRVVSLNVLTSNSNKEDVLEYLRQKKPDVIFLMEVDAGWAQALQALRSDYPHGLVRDQTDNFGVALLSRVPLRDVQLFITHGSDMPSIHASLNYEGRDLIILGTHPLPPMNGGMARSRDAQLRGVADWVRQSPVPVLVMGDLNATPWSHGMRVLRAGNSLAYRCPDPAWQPTWNPNTPFAVPIDHALCTPPLIIASRKIGPDVGSDHRPQELEITWE